jgi:23S rRNA (guanosine2251-2'-O)-methyltransferase
MNFNHNQPQQKFIFGIHSVLALLKTAPTSIANIYVLENRHDSRLEEILAFLSHHPKIIITATNRKELNNICPHSNHQGVIAELINAPKISDEINLRKPLGETDLETLLQKLDNENKSAFLVILDGVQDPHNLGAVLRSCDAAGVDAVIVPKDNSASLTPVVHKVACGATETIPFIQVTNLARAIRTLKENHVWLYAAHEKAEKNIYETNFLGNNPTQKIDSIALVFGAEGFGLRRLTQELCDFSIKIPLYGTVPSLNVSVAVGISLFEVRRQMQKTPTLLK